MKKSEWVIYGLIVLFLVVLVWWMWPKKNTGNVVETKNNTESGFVFMGKSDNSVKNEGGYVVSWDSKTEILTVNVNNKNKKYTILPGGTRVMIVQSQNKVGSKDLYVIEKAKQPLHWQQAFCPNDAVSIFTDSAGKVTTIMNTGYRACGFKEVLK
ncbi:hypothetical protein KBC75_04415 [Candidatus Shapirobacteria bacterium]|nr:hypothetical protein [Candidatus Shapirobacteria bacterium]